MDIGVEFKFAFLNEIGIEATKKCLGRELWEKTMDGRELW